MLLQHDDFEAKAVRHYLQRSATGRQWVALLVDSLTSLYGRDERPTVPDATSHPAERERAVSEDETPARAEREPVSVSEGEALESVGTSEEAAHPPGTQRR